MFGIKDEVIHKTAGACVIKDIVTRDFGGGEKTYYFLTPIFESPTNKSLEIYLPIEKEEFIRKPLTKNEALLLINDIPSMKNIWISDAKTRKLMFEEIYHNGNVKDFCRLVKILYMDNETLTKPLSLTDKNFLYKIKNHVFGEFALALNIGVNDVESYIEKFLK